MKFIQLTHPSGDPIYVSPSAVIAIESATTSEPCFLWLRGVPKAFTIQSTVSSVVAQLESWHETAATGARLSAAPQFPYHPDVVRYLEIAAFLLESGLMTTRALDKAADQLGGTSTCSARLKLIAADIDNSGSVANGFKAAGFPDFIADRLENNSTTPDLAHRFRLARGFILGQLTGEGGRK